MLFRSKQFVALQSKSSGFLSYSDRRLKEWKAFYEKLLAEARQETRDIAEMNQVLVDKLEFESKQREEMEGLLSESQVDR